jgi:hypothetical protein
MGARVEQRPWLLPPAPGPFYFSSDFRTSYRQRERRSATNRFDVSSSTRRATSASDCRSRATPTTLQSRRPDLYLSGVQIWLPSKCGMERGWSRSSGNLSVATPDGPRPRSSPGNVSTERPVDLPRPVPCPSRAQPVARAAVAFVNLGRLQQTAAAQLDRSPAGIAKREVIDTGADKR